MKPIPSAGLIYRDALQRINAQYDTAEQSTTMTQKTTRLTEHELLAFHEGLPRTWLLWTLTEEFQ